MKHIALFRGINVGGKNIVKMADLKKMLAGLGFEKVKTYIQSGNAVFEAADAPDTVKEKIRAAFPCTFGFESAVILRTGDEINAVINGLPFSRESIDAATAANPDVEHLYVYFLEDAPAPGTIESLKSGYGGPDRLLAGKREIYLLCHESVRDSKLAMSLAKLGIPMTARNWKTLNKLRDMLTEQV